VSDTRASATLEAASSQVRLLVVDDEAAQMHALRDTLRSRGYTTAGFTSPQAALEALRQEHFDLILTDLTMPEMDGIEFLTAARATDNDLVGIVMTGHGSIDTAVAAMKAGALDYILKPFTLRTMLPVIDRALTIRNLRAENLQLRQAEEMIRRMNEDLERRVDERTRQLTDANSELEAFSHSVSHDLRAPLRSLDGFAQLLSDEYGGLLSERGQEYVRHISDASRQMRSLIEDLLRLSQVNAVQLERRDFDLSQMVQSIFDELRRREPQRTIETDIEQAVMCNADPALLRIALQNLLGNAWKFTGKVTAPRIAFGAVPGQGYFIEDNGAGFDAEAAAEMFAPFRRLHHESEFPGTGIGLSIVQRIIRKHGGVIRAEGVVGKGARFTFSL
jgi:two-component system, sensor histidine kinase and response regulator